jgi:uncharacterized protein YdiU (UPF0061 family)
MSTKNIGWNFDNSYLQLPEIMATKYSPVPVKEPKVIIFNQTLAKTLGLDVSSLNDEEKATLFSGNSIPDNTQTFAQSYAGHQFGHFTMLGDGRAIVLGEHISPEQKRFDIQFKGSGRTPFSRGGDGRAALGPMLREYIISEAMFYLGIPTTRSLAVVATGEEVMRETPLPGAILTRVASSHIRVGTFEFVAAQKDINTLQALIKYSIRRHYPELAEATNPALTLFRAVRNRQIDLIVNYMRVGFIHGVLNTDNVAISGESIDYGPCAFMESYDPKTKFSSIDHAGRYAYGNQPLIAKWNLARFAETLIPLIDIDINKAVEILEAEVNQCSEIYKKKSLEMMRKKLGIEGSIEEDNSLITKLLQWMHEKQADYTNTFKDLTNGTLSNSVYQDLNFQHWNEQYQKRKPNVEIMKQHNPQVIPRNHKVEEALLEANKNNLQPLHSLLAVLQHPYEASNDLKHYQDPAPSSNEPYQTFCGT